MRRVAHLLALAVLAGGCSRDPGPVTGGALPQARLGQPVLTTGIVAGPLAPALPLESPYAPTTAVVDEGKRLYAWMNCAGCHGMKGGGGMGPPLADGDWIYGDGAGAIFQTIVQGRPNGMPAFPTLSDDQVWKVVAYVRTLSPVTERPTPAGTEPASSGEVLPDPARTRRGPATR